MGGRDGDISIGGAKFKNDGIAIALKPEMLQTSTTIFSKRDMEKEITNLE